MKQFTTFQIQKSISKLLNDLPFLIVKFDKPIAVVINYSQYQKDKEYQLYLEREVENLKRVPSTQGKLDAVKMNPKMAEFMAGQKQLLPCKWPKGRCFNGGVLGEYYEWSEGEIKLVPMVLCEKHQQLSNKIKDSNPTF